MSAAYLTDRIGYALGPAAWYECDSGKEVFISLLREFAQPDATFLPRFEEECAPLAHGHQKRPYVARTKAALFPGRPDLADDHAVEVLPGWFADTNLDHALKKKLLYRAIMLAGKTPGLDVEFNLGGGSSLTREQTERDLRVLLADFGEGDEPESSGGASTGDPRFEGCVRHSRQSPNRTE